MQWILLLFVYCFIGDNDCEENDNFVVLHSKNFPSYSIGVKNGDEVWIDEAQKFRSGFFKFKEVKGLAVKNADLRRRLLTEKLVSFEFEDNVFVRHSGFILYVHKRPENDGDGLRLFDEDATFVVREQEGKYNGYIQLESFNYPGRFIRHDGFHMRIENKKDDEDADAFKEVSSFLRISSKEDKSINIQMPLSRCYVGLDNSKVPRIVSEKSAVQFKMVRGLSDRGEEEEEEGNSDGDFDIVSFRSNAIEFINDQYLQHGTGSDNKKLIVDFNFFEYKAAASFKVIKDNADNSEYKAFQSVDLASHFIHSDGDKLTLQLITDNQDITAEKNRAIFFTFNHESELGPEGVLGKLATRNFHYIGIVENFQPWLFNVPTALQIVQGLAGSGTVSFKSKISTFLVSQMDAEKYCKLFRVSFAENNGELSFKSSASWYMEEIKDNHEYVFLRSYDCNEYYIHSSCDGLTVKKKSTSTEEGGFYFKINPHTR